MHWAMSAKCQKRTLRLNDQKRFNLHGSRGEGSMDTRIDACARQLVDVRRNGGMLEELPETLRSLGFE